MQKKVFLLTALSFSNQVPPGSPEPLDAERRKEPLGPAADERRDVACRHRRQCQPKMAVTESIYDAPIARVGADQG
jgi:hypothetical protein